MIHWKVIPPTGASRVLPAGGPGVTTSIVAIGRSCASVHVAPQERTGRLPQTVYLWPGRHTGRVVYRYGRTAVQCLGEAGLYFALLSIARYFAVGAFVLLCADGIAVGL